MRFIVVDVVDQVIMKDKWMNIGYEDDELKPHHEPPHDFNDPIRIGVTNKLICICYQIASRLSMASLVSIEIRNSIIAMTTKLIFRLRFFITVILRGN